MWVLTSRNTKFYSSCAGEQNTLGALNQLHFCACACGIWSRGLDYKEIVVKGKSIIKTVLVPEPRFYFSCGPGILVFFNS